MSKSVTTDDLLEPVTPGEILLEDSSSRRA